MHLLEVFGLEGDVVPVDIEVFAGRGGVAFVELAYIWCQQRLFLG